MLGVQIRPGEDNPLSSIQVEGVVVRFRTGCPPEMIAPMTVDPGIGIFWHFKADAPERQKRTLLEIARSPDGKVVLAYTNLDRIVGYIVLCDPEPSSRWALRGPRSMYELGAMETSRAWRGKGIAYGLHQALFTDGSLEDRIVYTMGFAWHWDLAASGLHKRQYRERLMALWSRFGFHEYGTDEPDILEDSANLFAARPGSRVSPEDTRRFHDCLVEDYARLLMM